MNERVNVKVLLLFGDQAELVTDVPADERAEPVRYPAVGISAAVGLELQELPGRSPTAAADPDDRLPGWQLA
ncbi:MULTISPECIES: hypothetical protein [unclassified Streptomyces]|uniref:hypothetical protein n=1 Tax=unclassified Streptomyces TaxID=2593676 RepID=UPI0033E6547E